MRYFMTILLTPDQEALSAPPELEAAMGPFIEKHLGDGSLISTAGLMRSSNGVRITGKAGRTTAKDGPFTEAKELIGGYAILELPDRDAALAVARDFVQLHIDNGWPDLTVEVRAIEGGVNY